MYGAFGVKRLFLALPVLCSEVCPGKAQIERKLVEDAVRPIIFFMRQGTCWQPEVKGLTLMENSIFNSWRMEEVWLEGATRPMARAC